MKLPILGYVLVLAMLYASIMWCVQQEPYAVDMVWLKTQAFSIRYIECVKFLCSPVYISKLLTVIAVGVLSMFIIEHTPLVKILQGGE